MQLTFIFCNKRNTYFVPTVVALALVTFLAWFYYSAPGDFTRSLLKVEKHGRDKKIIVFKYKPKKNYRRKKRPPSILYQGCGGKNTGLIDGGEI